MTGTLFGWRVEFVLRLSRVKKPPPVRYEAIAIYDEDRNYIIGYRRGRLLLGDEQVDTKGETDAGVVFSGEGGRNTRDGRTERGE